MNDHTEGRRVFSVPVLVLLALLAVMILLVPVSSADDGPPVKVSATNTATPGEIEITLDENPGILSLKLSIDYDSSAMYLKEVIGGDVLILTTSDPEKSPFILYGEGSDPNNAVTSTGVFATLVFGIKDGAEDGQYPVLVSAVESVDGDLEDVDVDVVSGVVTVGLPLKGDVDGDGKINLLDALKFRKHLAEDDSIAVVESNCDLNGDGLINSKDSLLLRRYLAGNDIVFPAATGDATICIDYCGTVFPVSGIDLSYPIFISISDPTYKVEVSDGGSVEYVNDCTYKVKLKASGSTVSISAGHEHDYGNLIGQVDATCIADGVKEHYQCSVCGGLFVSDGSDYTEVTVEDLKIEALGHAWGAVDYSWTHPIGDEETYLCCATRSCTRDGCDITESEYGTVTYMVVTEPTCLESGLRSYLAVFTLFDRTSKDVVTSPLGHNLVSYPAKAPTTTEVGWYAYEACDRPGCGYTTKVEYGPVGSFTVTVFGGTAEAVGVSASQTINVPENTVVTIKATAVDGKTFCYWSTHKGDLSPVEEGDEDCTLRILVNQNTYVTAHYTEDYEYEQSNAVCVIESTGCDVDALYMIPATGNSDYAVYYTIPALGHITGSESFVERDATCTETGVGYYLCSCGFKEYFEIPAKGHDFINPVITDEAHGSHVGTKLLTCKSCGETTEKPYISAELPSGDLKVTVYVYDTYYGNKSTVTRDEIHYTFKVTDAQGVERQAYLYYIYHPNTAQYGAKYETWFLWIDYGDDSPVYICRNQYNDYTWQYDNSHYQGGIDNKWGILGYADTMEEFSEFIDGMHVGHDNGISASVLLDIYREWEEQYNLHGPEYFEIVGTTVYCGYECTVYKDIDDNMFYTVNEDNCCLMYTPVYTYCAVNYYIKGVEEITEFTSLYDLTGDNLGNIPTKDIIYFYHVNVTNGVDLTEDRIVLDNGIAHYCFDVDDTRMDSSFDENIIPADSTLVTWQILDLDGNWVDVSTKTYATWSNTYYMFDEDVYGGKTLMDVYLYLSEHPELGRFVQVSAPEFSDIKLRALYEKNESATLTTVGSSFQDRETYTEVTSGTVYVGNTISIYADIPSGKEVDHWTYVVDGVEMDTVPYGSDGSYDIGYYDECNSLCLYILGKSDIVVTAVFRDAEGSCGYDVVFQATEGGYTTGSTDGTYDEGCNIHAIAYPYYGYTFVGWFKMDSEGGYEPEGMEAWEYEEIYGYLCSEDIYLDDCIWGSCTYTAVFAKTDVSVMYKVFVQNGYVYSEGNDVYLSAIYRFYTDYDFLYADPNAEKLHKWEVSYWGDTERVHISDEDDIYGINYIDDDVYVIGVFESEIQYYTVEFLPNGGTGSMETVTICEDTASNYCLPDNEFSKENHDFIGWSTDPGSNVAGYADGECIEVTSDIVLYAVWKASSHNVNLSVGNDIYGYGYFYRWSGSSSFTVTFGEDKCIPSVDSLFDYCHGFDIVGWKDNEGNVYSATGDVVVPYSVRSLEAVVEFWTVTFVFESNGGIGTMAPFTATFEGTSNCYLPDDTVYYTKNGYYIGDWYLNADCSGSYVSSGKGRLNFSTLFNNGVENGDTVTLYPKWNAQYYSVRYDYNAVGTGTTSGGGFYITYAVNFNSGNNYSLNGCKVVEWNTAADGSGNGYTPGTKIDTASFIQTEYVGKTSVTLYAIWSGPVIKYDADGGTGVPECTTYVVGEYLDSYFGTVEPTKDGVKFAGWSLEKNGELIGPLDKVTSDIMADDGSITFYAVYGMEFIVRYDINGGTGTQPSDGTAVDGKYFGDVLVDVTESDLKKGGWTIGGWSLTADGSAIGYYDRIDLSALAEYMDSDVLTVYAVYLPPTVTVVFDLNGGDGTAPEPVTVAYGSAFPMPSETPVKEGTYFLMWNTEADGTGLKMTSYVYLNSSNIAVSDTLTVYACWNPFPYDPVVGDTMSITMESVSGSYHSEQTVDIVVLEVKDGIYTYSMKMGGSTDTGSSACGQYPVPVYADYFLGVTPVKSDDLLVYDTVNGSMSMTLKADSEGRVVSLQISAYGDVYTYTFVWS